MGKYDYLFNDFKSVQQELEKEKFNYFMMGLVSGIESDLNKAYVQGEIRGLAYSDYLASVKSKGFKVLRNNKGKHKVEVR
jgi:hypothetical protein